jgi:hypothetical protein
MVLLSSATTDLKWFEWIEEHFNVASLQGRKITFEQFKETLQLEQVFSASLISYNHERQPFRVSACRNLLL